MERGERRDKSVWRSSNVVLFGLIRRSGYAHPPPIQYETNTQYEPGCRDWRYRSTPKLGEAQNRQKKWFRIEILFINVVCFWSLIFCRNFDSVCKRPGFATWMSPVVYKKQELLKWRILRPGFATWICDLDLRTGFATWVLVRMNIHRY